MNRVAWILTTLCILCGAGTCVANVGGPDAFGYRFVDSRGDSATFAWIELCGDPLAINGPTGHNNVSCFSWGWNFPFYGTNYTSGCFSTNGLMTMLGSNSSPGNICGLSGVEPPWPTIYPYWDDLRAASVGGCVEVVGPWLLYRDFGSYLVLEWKRIQHNVNSSDRYSFEAILFPDGRIKFQYNMDWAAPNNPTSATIGVDAPGAGNGLEYLCNGVPASSIAGPGLAVWMYIPQPIGRCCYGIINCIDNTQSQCAQLSGSWAPGLNCLDHPCAPCVCPNPELEPNEFWPPTQVVNLGQEFCGTISTAGDVDLFRLNLPSVTPIKITIFGNGSPGTCPFGQGLHPIVEILEGDSSSVAIGVDTTNTATQFTSGFSLGAWSYALRISGAAGTTGPYVARVDPAPPAATVAPPEPIVTLYRTGGNVILRWQAGYFPEEQLQIERALTSDGAYSEIGTVSGNVTQFSDTIAPDRAFYRVIASGQREPDPLLGTIMTLADLPRGLDQEEIIASYVIDEIEHAVDDYDNIVIARLRAHGISPYENEQIDTDNRMLYGSGLSPIRNFDNHTLFVDGKYIHVDHVAMVANSSTGEAEVVTGMGTDVETSSPALFSASPQRLIPDHGENVAWHGCYPPWTDLCSGFCCRMGMYAICRMRLSMLNRPECTALSGGFPIPPKCACDSTWTLGCPCAPPAPPDFSCTTENQDTCSPCSLKTRNAGAVLFRFCVCPKDTVPPTISYFDRTPCIWAWYVKCRHYDCFLEPNCVCCLPAFAGSPPVPPLPRVCPATTCIRGPLPSKWTRVPWWLVQIYRAACKGWCVPPSCPPPPNGC